MVSSRAPFNTHESNTPREHPTEPSFERPAEGRQPDGKPRATNDCESKIACGATRNASATGILGGCGTTRIGGLLMIKLMSWNRAADPLSGAGLIQLSRTLGRRICGHLFNHYIPAVLHPALGNVEFRFAAAYSIEQDDPNIVNSSNSDYAILRHGKTLQRTAGKKNPRATGVRESRNGKSPAG